MSQTQLQDHCLRAMTTEDGFRALGVRTTETVQRAIDAQGVSGEVARIYGELLTGVVLIRETMAPKLRVQAILKRLEGGSMVADSHPSGRTRGLVNLKGASAIELGPQTHLQMVRELPNGELHQGVVATAPEYGLSASLTTYMARSEQIETAIGVGCKLDGDRVVAAGGYLIQHMPNADMDVLAQITASLEQLGSIESLLVDNDADPQPIFDRMLDGIGHDVLHRSEVQFGCNCSTERFLNSLSTLGRAEIEELVADDEPLDITCDYCAEQYLISTNRLRDLLEAG
ncbi:MAG: Hsp33 family molecular chaperone HslO [Persicimonas sp.]